MSQRKGDNKPLPRSRLSLKQKFQLIKDHEDKVDVEKLKEKYNCSRSVVYKIISNKKTIIDEYISTQNVDAKTKIRSAKFEAINELTYNWFTQVVAKNLPVSGAMVQEKAREIAIENGDKDFKASNGWLESFKNRHQLTFSAVCGESKDVNMQPVNDFVEKLPELIAGYKIEDIGNCDETALFFRALPRKTLHKKGDKCYGGKQSKERLTILLCCFADGKFEKPLVIVKSQNPRCFKSVKKESLPVSWYANKKAWMTASIMEQFLIQLNKKMVIQKRNILLFLDNASSHPNLKLSNIELVFLPPNTTSETQPLDRGIINAIKVQYRKRVLKRLICKMDTAENVSDLVKGISYVDAICWLKESIDNLSEKTVPNCFRKAGFQLNDGAVASAEVPASGNVDISEEDIPLSELRALMTQAGFGDLPPEEFASFDDAVLTESDAIFSAIERPSKENSADEAETENDVDDENAEQNENKTVPIKHTEALDKLEEIKFFAYAKENPFLLDKIEECINLVQDDLIANKNKQSSITDFFSKVN